jgi:hypothetical protein
MSAFGLCFCPLHIVQPFIITRSWMFCLTCSKAVTLMNLVPFRILELVIETSFLCKSFSLFQGLATLNEIQYHVTRILNVWRLASRSIRHFLRYLLSSVGSSAKHYDELFRCSLYFHFTLYSIIHSVF